MTDIAEEENAGRQAGQGDGVAQSESESQGDDSQVSSFINMYSFICFVKKKIIAVGVFYDS